MAGRKPYASLGLDLTGWSGLTTISGQSRGTWFSFDTPGLVVGVRLAVWSASVAPGMNTWFGIRGSPTAGSATTAQRPKFASVSPKVFNGTIPGWRNCYFERPYPVDTSHYYQVWVFGQWQYEVRTGALASVPISNGHITALQNVSSSGRWNSITGTNSNFPISTMPNVGDMISLDVLFLPS